MFDMVPNMPRVLSEYGKVLNMQALHGVLNIPEYIWQSSACIWGTKYAGILNTAGLWICKSYTVF